MVRISGVCSTSAESSSLASRKLRQKAGCQVGEHTWKQLHSQSRSNEKDSGDSSVDKVSRRSERRIFEDEDLTTSQPEVEVYCDGSWWNVNILRYNGHEYMVHYEAFTVDYDEWVLPGNFRLRSRVAVETDCQTLLNLGMDVCVFAIHPQGPKGDRAWFDAKIMKIERHSHTPKIHNSDTSEKCKCLFYVQFYTIPEKLPQDGKLRDLVKGVKGTQSMSLRQMTIIQKAYNMSTGQILASALPGHENSVKRKWSVDSCSWFSQGSPDKLREPSTSLESRVASGIAVVCKSSRLIPFDSFLEEEGINREPEEESLGSEEEGDVLPIPSLRPREKVETCSNFCGSKKQPIMLDDSDSDSLCGDDPATIPGIRIPEEFSGYIQAKSLVSGDDLVAEDPDPIRIPKPTGFAVFMDHMYTGTKGHAVLRGHTKSRKKSKIQSGLPFSCASKSNNPKEKDHLMAKQALENDKKGLLGKQGGDRWALPNLMPQTGDCGEDPATSPQITGLEDFTADLERWIMTESHAVQHCQTQAKIRTKARVALRVSQVSGAKRKQGKSKGVVNVVQEVTYTDLFKAFPGRGADQENVSKEKAPCSLMASWNPLLENWGPAPVSNKVEEDPRMQNAWEDMRLALESETFQSRSKVEEEKPEAPVGTDNKCTGLDGSDHSFLLDLEVGLVCQVCGFVGLEIGNMWTAAIGQRYHYHGEGNEVDESTSEDMDLSWDLNGEALTQSGSAKGPSLFDAIPELKQHMQKHQKEGFEFLWKNLAGLGPGGEPALPAMETGGCVLSHAPGTGKTFLIISFLQSYLKVNPKCRPLIIAPKIMLRPWEKEFRKWNVDIPVYILNQALQIGRALFQQHEESGDVRLKCGSRVPVRRMRDIYRQAMMWQWLQQTSVLAISYALFTSLTDSSSPNPSEDGFQIRKMLLEQPTILILDEGHFARNKKAKVLKALMLVQTPMRIMLSGTLFQNNFEELFTTLYLVRPRFVESFSKSGDPDCGIQGSGAVGDADERSATEAAMDGVTRAAEARARRMFIDEIGSKIDSGQRKKGSSKSLARGLDQLQKLTSPFVHHHTGDVLQSLPPLRDFSIMLQPTPLQDKMLKKLAERLGAKTQLEQEILMSAVCIHPFLFTQSSVGETLPDLLSAPEMMKLATDQNPEGGVKTNFVVNLLRLLQTDSDDKEKMLIFSQNLQPLSLLERMFESAFGWVKDRDFLQLDGHHSLGERQTIIERFNQRDGGVHVLLASTKACGEGITLTGASRVVFMDVLWNPAVIRQAISRAFRLGQTRIVYVYRLVASGTFEEKKYRMMVCKDMTSRSIFNSSVDEGEGVAAGGGEKNPSEARSSSLPCFWEMARDSTKDARLGELLRQDDVSGLQVFRTVFRHGGLFDKDYDTLPGGRGMDASDWLRGDQWGREIMEEEVPESGSDDEGDDDDEDRVPLDTYLLIQNKTRKPPIRAKDLLVQ